MLASFVLLGCLGTACSENEVPTVDQSVLLAAPESLSDGGQTFVLSPTLWRDFQPVSPRRGKPLGANIRMVETSMKAITSDLDPEYLWVIKEGEIWSASLKNEGAPTLAYIRERIARGGPKWDPGILVDVVVGLPRRDGQLLLLKAASQRIVRAE